MRSESAITNEVSHRISISRFPIILGVVYLHAGGIIGYGHSGVSSLVSHYISTVTASVCVPMFFIISGYLFFHNHDGTMGTHRAKIISRIHSLFIPMVFWNALTLAGILALQNIPALCVLRNDASNNISLTSILGVLNAILGLTGAPAAPQFWFIRDLFMIVLLSPIFSFFYNKYPWIGFILLVPPFTCDFLLRKYHLLPLHVMRPVFLLSWSPLYFYIGALLHRFKYRIECLDKFRLLAISLYLVSGFWEAALIALNADMSDSSMIFLHFFNIFLGIFALWTFFSFFPPGLNKILVKFSAFSFFLFAVFHHALYYSYALLRHIIAPPVSTAGFIIAFCLFPFAVSMAVMGLGAMLNKHGGLFFKIIIGNRNTAFYQNK